MLLTAVFALAVSQPAYAHDELIGSSPAAGSSVDELPDEVELTFSAVLLAEPAATDVVVTDAAGADLTEGDLVIDGTRITQPLSGTAAGVVTVIWRVVSSDGHPVSGEFTFTVGDGSSAAPTESFTPLPGPPMEAIEDAPWRWVWIVAGILAVGAGGALVAVLVARARGSRED